MPSTGQPAPSGVAPLRTVPRQPRGKATLARMLDAADRLMAAEGADAVTTTRIAAEAGVSVGSVYRYLPHRGAIIEALARRYLSLLEDQLDRMVVALRAGTWRPTDLVGETIDAFATFYRDHPGFRALWFGRHLTAETALLDRAHKHRMAERIRDMLATRGVTGSDATTLRIGQVIQLSTDAVIQEAFRASPDGDEELLAQLKTQIRSYLDSLPTR
jgi:AcrR family transcriptional regulator